MRLVSIAAAAALTCAVAAGAEKPPEKKPRRLESVTWNSVDHKLTWVISTGERQTGGKYKPTSSATYEITMDAAIMTYNGEDRRFSRQEAVSVRSLMDLISKYAVESTVWWDTGQGDKVDKNNPPEPVQEPRTPPRKPPVRKNVVIAQR